MIKNCKFSCLLLIWQQTVIAAKRAIVRCGDDDHIDLELQIWEKFLQFLWDTWGNPSYEYAPPAALPLSLTSLGKISFNLLGLPTAPCPSLFSSHGTKASIQASPNPNSLSTDSQKSFALYCQGVSSSIQRSIQGWTRKPIRTQVPVCNLDHWSLFQMGRWWLQEAILWSGRRKADPLLPLSGPRAVTVYAPKEHLCTQVISSAEVARTKLYNKLHPRATLYTSVI